MALTLGRARNIYTLRKSYRYVKPWKTKLWISLLFFMGISFVLLFLEPFKTGESPKMLILGYCLCVLLAYSIVLVSESLIFYFLKRWTLRDESLMYILFFLLSALGVYWYDLVVIKEQTYYWSSLFSFTGRVTLPFAILFLPVIGWLRHYYGSLYELSEQYQVVIKGNVKSDVLEMDWRKILYARSSDNYVIIKYITESEVLKETLLRSTLSQVEEQLPDLLKCHRSYLINPLYLVAVEGNQKKAFLKLDKLEEEIPLSKTYYAGIKALLN
ncbi:LytTR family transcriptional regulator [Fulvivirga ulvae]|uniref:LytTR family DNA-binding domain-containing protein n=1 Tax=Fulvivirga ulvae TaxID=2904245 RepID=UPI001F468191|nr:LytTR family DNA-binding domain-containing protein [Fulvivirga ulvae]UII31057.1 LytTR family transcriptional regulator [Fulvivirga ulvae]